MSFRARPGPFVRRYLRPLVFLCDGTAGQMGDVAMRYGNDLHALLRLPVRQDHRIGTKLVANLLHCLTCRRGDEFSDAHALPPTIAVTRIVLKSGTSSCEITLIFGTARFRKRASRSRSCDGTSMTAGRPICSCVSAAARVSRSTVSASPGSMPMPFWLDCIAWIRRYSSSLSMPITCNSCADG